ncbi:cancer-related nucleoside-triphosphatase homolog isoform X1 [Paramacrobiotus metropolitanus]|uniref:cancer-related nucleoside-triphosphatase homolog isoform X1 n=1 Tax=Paramacrobiotus metropolitanus TaxID=2943436 RepID=UPI0024462BFD|nr:cancer-related nucleoside-triphosphatase homolog isoform X1 [Paramacrobiotus metropolitanus]XP_055328136.1 cancer-related nucleoside-triphosphatase homolog isoform X1 [Paramacrobiotus metropolitanus]
MFNGFCTDEQRTPDGIRSGFIVRDLVSGATCPLATIELYQFRLIIAIWILNWKPVGPAPTLGKYYVQLERFESLVLPMLEAAAASSEPCVFFCDEIGSMELKSPRFFPAVRKLLDCSGVRVVGTLPARGKLPPAVVDILQRNDVQIFQISQNNRGDLPGVIVNHLEDKASLQIQTTAQLRPEMNKEF